MRSKRITNKQLRYALYRFDDEPKHVTDTGQTRAIVDELQRLGFLDDQFRKTAEGLQWQREQRNIEEQQSARRSENAKGYRGTIIERKVAIALIDFCNHHKFFMGLSAGDERPAAISRDRYKTLRRLWSTELTRLYIFDRPNAQPKGYFVLRFGAGPSNVIESHDDTTTCNYIMADVTRIVRNIIIDNDRKTAEKIAKNEYYEIRKAWTAFDKAAKAAENKGRVAISERIRAEQAICETLSEWIVNHDFGVDIWNGEEVFRLPRGGDALRLTKTLRTKAVDVLRLVDAAGEQVGGAIRLVYGRMGYDVLATPLDALPGLTGIDTLRKTIEQHRAKLAKWEQVRTEAL